MFSFPSYFLILIHIGFSNNSVHINSFSRTIPFCTEYHFFCVLLSFTQYTNPRAVYQFLHRIPIFAKYTNVRAEY